MAKKKTSTPDYLQGYVPASFQPQVQTAEIIKIPPYEDASVRYQGYSKRLAQNSSYILSKQKKVYETGLITSSNNSDSYSLAKNQKFTVTGILLVWDVAGAADTDYVYIGDWDGASTTLLVRKVMNLVNTTGSVFIDLSSAPFELQNSEGGFGWTIGTFPSLSVGESIHYQISGFIEDY